MTIVYEGTQPAILPRSELPTLALRSSSSPAGIPVAGTKTAADMPFRDRIARRFNDSVSKFARQRLRIAA